MKLTLSQFRSRQSAFTMVEIALCLAIVGFALVAIIGVLPAGLNVQKENREDTLLNQEATVWFDALRAGGVGPYYGGSMDELTNYVDRIVVNWALYDVTPSSTNLNKQGSYRAQREPAADIIITNGAQIVGLLSTPKIIAGNNSFVSNYVYAYVRAINGNASDKAPQDNQNVRDLAFSYRMMVEIVPAGVFDPESIQTNAVDLTLRKNLSDVRLLFRWPLQKPFQPNQGDPGVGSGRMSFRTQLGGSHVSYPDANNFPFYYLQPRTYK
jgi:Flp pilus assembly pilin Flp